MKQAFGLVRRPWSVFYLKNKITGEQESLKTRDKLKAQRILQAHNESECQPHFKPEARAILPQSERMFPGRTNLSPEEVSAARKEDGLSRQLRNQRCQAFVFTNLKTGQSTTNGYQYAWLNHLQFSPTDPNLLLYCHEGTWHEVDRIWMIRTDGSEQRLMHQRSMDMEIAGHEFWSHDGKTIWFDLQTPRSQDFWIAGVNVKTGKEIAEGYHQKAEALEESGYHRIATAMRELAKGYERDAERESQRNPYGE